MKLRWINKNIEKEVLVDNPIDSNFSEDLDSATALLLSQTQRLNIEILDEVVLLNDDNSIFEYFCIGDYEEKEVNPAEPHYDYTLTLISQTKELEGIILPNLSITKTSRNRSVWYYLNNYLNLYGQKVRKNTPHGKLPDAYKEVEYIQSNGLQYIDTKVIPDKYTGMRVDYSEVSLLPSYTRGIAGTRQIIDGSPIKSFGFGYEAPETIEGVLKAARIAYYNNQSFVKTEYDLGDSTYGYETEGGKLYQYQEKNELTLGDDVWSHVFYPPPFAYPQYQSDFTGYGSIYLFAFNETVVHPTALKLYGCKIFQNNVMVRNFVPCYRVSDGKIGLYDLIDRMFYTNAGLGEFIKPDTDVPYIVEPNWQLKWHFAPSVQNKFEKILCPEMQWNRPTLREVFNDLMMVENCIPILNNNEIGFLDLSARLNTKLLKEHINFIHRNKTLESYTTELEMELQNVIQDSTDGVYNLTNITEYIGFRNEDEFALSTQNSKVYTKNPIYDIKHFWLCVELKIQYMIPLTNKMAAFKVEYVEIDLCNIKGLNFVKEYKEYLTLELAYNTSDTGTLEDMNKYQNFSLYYNRGGKEVNGFFDETKKFWFINKSFLELLLQKVVDELKLTPNFLVKWGTISADLSNLLINGVIKEQDFSFKIEYQSLSTSKFKAGKLLPYENERIVVDNQTNSYVNALKQGVLEYLKANRLGNEILLINSRYDSLSSDGLVNVGSTYGEITGYDDENNPIYDDSYVIFKRQIQINPNYVNVIYYATRHYVLKDYYTGVKAKIRSWKIENEESLIRNELHKYYYEFSFDNKLINDELPISENIMLSSFKTHYEDEIMKYSLIRSLIGYDNSILLAEPDIVFPEDDFDSYGIVRPFELNHLKYILTELNNKVMGSSIVFDTKMADNWGVGVRVKGKEKLKDAEGEAFPIEQEIRYVDDYGELREMYFTMTSEMNINKADDINWSFPKYVPNTNLWFDRYSIEVSDGQNLAKLFMKKPLAQEYIIINENDAYNETFEIFKDQREVTALSLQLEYCSASENIVFGNQIVKDNNLISTNYREDYNDIEGEFTISGDLIDIAFFDDISDVPSPTDIGQAAIVGIEEDDTITYSYYLSQIEPASYTLYSKDLLSEEYVMELGSQLDGEYVIGITYSYTYPIPSGSTYKNIVNTDTPPSYTSGMPSATTYNNKYMIAWAYAARTLFTMTIDWDFFVADIVAPVDSYRIVKHADNNTIIVGELAYDSSSRKPAFSDYGPTSTKPSASRNQGKFVVFSNVGTPLLRLMVSTYNSSTQEWEWVQATDSNNKLIYMNQSSDVPSGAVSYYGSHYSFYYSGDTQQLIYYWSGGYMPPYYRFTAVDLSSQTFKYYLQQYRSNGWFTYGGEYNSDTTSVYIYNNTYYQWINKDWTTNISSSASKVYNWYHAVSGEWQYDSAASTGDYGYLGDTTDSLDTEWYSFTYLHTYSLLGNTTREPSSYKLYTYSNGSISDVSNLLSDNLFFYENKNYQWNVTDPDTNAGTWVDNTNYVWNNQGSPDNKYFKYEGNVYGFIDDNLVFQQTLIPKRNINRTDLRLFKSFEKIRVYDMNYLPNELDRVEITNWDFSIGSNYIELTGLSGDSFSYYLTDSNLNVLLAFNAPKRMSLSTRIYLNGYKSRNKKIYN